MAVKTDFEQEREEYIQRSSQERDFFDYYVGRPHPAMIGAGRRRRRRGGVRATGSRVARTLLRTDPTLSSFCRVMPATRAVVDRGADANEETRAAV